MAGIQHPNVVSVSDVFDQDGQLGLVMEYVEGGSLRGWLERGDHFETRQVIRWLLDVLGGVGELHRQDLIHRDIKPDNILMSSVKGEWVPKVTDLGVVQDQSAARVSE